MFILRVFGVAVDVTSDDEATNLMQWISSHPLYDKCHFPTYHLRNIMDYNCSEGPAPYFEDLATNPVVQYVKSTVDPEQYDAVGKFMAKRPDPQQLIMKMLTTWKVPQDLEVLDDDEAPPVPPKPSPTGAADLDEEDLAAIGEATMMDNEESVPDSYDRVVEESQARDDSTPTGEDWEDYMDDLKEKAWQDELEGAKKANANSTSDDKSLSF